MFQKLAGNTSGSVVINRDDPNLARLGFENAVSFGIEEDADFRAEDVAMGHFQSAFAVRGVRIRLSLPGLYNVYNALSAIAVLSVLGVPLKDIASVLPGFDGVERRFDIHLNGRRLVVDDYAHNPHKIASLMQAAGGVRKNICYIFQPHGFAPTRMMKNEYIEAFSGHLRPSDHLLLLPIFYAGGTVAKDVSSEDLAAGVRRAGKSAEAVEGRGEILARLEEWENFIVMGARDDSLSAFASEIAGRIRGSAP
jgi:UDP-N-acetylmuramate--alanine ligase